MVKNIVLDDAAIQQLHRAVLQRIALHNANIQDPDFQLTPVYVVRFDNRGYKTYSEDEAWEYYKSAGTVERVVLQAESVIGVKTNYQVGAQIEIRLDTDANASSHILVGGDSRDWVETTFTALEEILSRQKSTATSVIRTQWMVLALQLIGVFAGLLLCLWLATLSAPYLSGVEYPRALSFAFWFLVYSNLWGYIQMRALTGIGIIFPTVRFSRKGEHWTQVVVRKAFETSGLAILLWALAWLTKWAASVIAPFVTLGL
ncbi:hypothetical protein [Alcaligenes sp. SJTW-7]|uniref:hypothetical protein n=1 Tax=Alcaligenes sp. SJTW-7 TaxID=3078429 RepID=UPI0039E9DA38